MATLWFQNENKVLSKLREKYKFVEIVLYYKDLYLSPDNYNIPFKKYWKIQSFVLNTARLQIIQLYLQDNIIIKSHQKFLFPHEETFNKTSKHEVWSIPAEYFDEIDDPNNHLFELQFLKSYNKNIIEIRYYSFDDIISVFGGTFGVISSFIQSIFLIFAHFFLKKKMINDVFDFHETTFDQSKSREYYNIPSIQSIKVRRKGIAPLSNIEILNDSKYLRNDHLFLRVKPQIVPSDKIIMNSNSNNLNEGSINDGKQENDNESINCEGDSKVNEVIADFKNIIRSKKKIKISCCEIFLAMAKFHFGWKLTNKQILINKSNQLIEENLEYTSFIKMSLDFHMLRNILIEKDYIEYTSFPSININSDNAISRLADLELNTSKRTWDNERVLVKLSKENMQNQKYLKIFENFLDSNI